MLSASLTEIDATVVEKSARVLASGTLGVTCKEHGHVNDFENSRECHLDGVAMFYYCRCVCCLS